MNLRSEIVIEIIKNERTYRFSVPIGAPFAEAFDVATEFAQGVIELSKQAERQDASASESKKEGE